MICTMIKSSILPHLGLECLDSLGCTGANSLLSSRLHHFQLELSTAMLLNVSFKPGHPIQYSDNILPLGLPIM